MIAQWQTFDGETKQVHFTDGKYWRLNIFPYGENPTVRQTNEVLSIVQHHQQLANIKTRPVINGVVAEIDYSLTATQERPGIHQAIIVVKKPFTMDFTPENFPTALVSDTINPVRVYFII